MVLIYLCMRRWVYQNPERHQEAQDARQALQYSHMGMLAVLPNSSLAAAWQAAEVYWEGSSQQGIYWAVSEDGNGDKWGKPSLLVPPPDDGLPAWGPVLHVEVRLCSGTACTSAAAGSHRARS